ncbi:tapasin-related protein-like [Erpetoichthys calabaricus]|uniref:tapasin-related protein-like n=1 Tax=Erpetoichthys calabaricus TaxID=27687 RepID=UPI0022348462|nr:tapasin-related protein-like [Erpetoichthys calabaricus]
MAGLGLELLLLLLQMHGANPNTVSQSVVSVKQTPAVLVALRGATVYLPCTFSVLDTSKHPTAKCAVQWYKTKEGQEPSRNCTLTLRTSRLSLAHPEPSLRVQNASLVIRNLTLEDTGVYYCSVTIWQKGTGQGNGTHLRVYATPTAPQVLLQVSTDPGATSLALICKTRGFQPSNISLIWTRDPYLPKPMAPVNQQQLLNVAANEQQVTSHLSVFPWDITGAVYTCEVWHVSLAEPLKASLCWGECLLF